MRLVDRGAGSPQEIAVAALQRQRRRMVVPSNESGGVVATESTLFRSAECALQLEIVRVFSTGVQFQFRAIQRKRTSQPSMLGVSPSGNDALWVGVELADGRKAANGGGRFLSGDLPEDAVTLARSGGSGHGNWSVLTYLLTPVPPPGPLSLVVAWPVFGIDESISVIAGDELAAAAARIVTLWPAEVERERYEPSPAARPPAGGWFEQNPLDDRPPTRP